MSGPPVSGPPVLLRHRLRIAREYAGFTQPQLAHVVGVAFNTVSQWEIGKRWPGDYELRKFAKECGVSLDWLHQGVPNRCIPCPVCWRDVQVSYPGRFVPIHKDKAYNHCPMSSRQVDAQLMGVAA